MLNTNGFAHNDIGLEVDAHLSQILDFNVYNLVGQTELGNAVFQHTANLMQGLEDIDVVAFLHHIASEAQSGRT